MTNKDNINEDDYVYDSLCMLTTVIFMVSVLFIKKKQKKMFKLIDEAVVSVSDFTIMINNIPKFENEDTIKDFIENSIPGV